MLITYHKTKIGRYYENLYENYRDVFQVIYKAAGSIEWHHFWLKHLVPVLRAEQNADEFAGHAHHIAQWKNDDAVGVLSFWLGALALDWFDSKRIAVHLGYYLADIKHVNITLVPQLLERLLAMARLDHYSLGRVIARCLTAGVVDDSVLWRYNAADVREEDLLGYSFDNKLHCLPHEFGDQADNFLLQRIKQSVVLLDFAIDSIEWWSIVRASRYGENSAEYRFGFLAKSSYEDTHSQRDIRHTGSLNVLLDAVESAILNQAGICSEWWLRNRERLCFSSEGALRYFGILACTVSPEPNIDLIGRILQDKSILMNELSYEIGSLIHSAFQFLDTPTQNAVMSCILMIWEDEVENASNRFWILEKRAELIAAVRAYLRSPEAQSIVVAYVEKYGFLIRQPQIRSYGGMVIAPFSFEVFLNASDTGILSLLKHYDGYAGSHRAGLLTGGEREVGWQLREAASRHPTRFIEHLKRYWNDIPGRFRNDILDGACAYLDYRYGCLKANNAWMPIAEPDSKILSELILDELERHPAISMGSAQQHPPLNHVPILSRIHIMLKDWCLYQSGSVGFVKITPLVAIMLI